MIAKTKNPPTPTEPRPVRPLPTTPPTQTELDRQRAADEGMTEPRLPSLPSIPESPTPKR